MLAGKKFTPPVRGEALVEFTQPVTKPLPGKNMVQTTIKVRNASPAPIARLQVTETWYDKAGAHRHQRPRRHQRPAPAGRDSDDRHRHAVQRQDDSNNWNFTHANGTVKLGEGEDARGAEGRGGAAK